LNWFVEIKVPKASRHQINLTQALNAVLLLVPLPFTRRLAKSPEVMGEHALTGLGRALTGAVIALIAGSVGTLVVLTVSGL
jgi:Mn2+/Fe2+ NRAMP family transporter